MITAAEIYFEHDRASFGNRMMWLPVALGPVGFAAGMAGVFSKRAAKTVLPLRLDRDHRQRAAGHLPACAGNRTATRGWALGRYNIEMGPPMLAPLLMTMVGGMGLLAAILRREGE